MTQDELRLDCFIDLNAILLCYDVTNSKSFDNLKVWMKEIKEHVDHINVMVVGLKTDKKQNRVVKERDVAAFAKEHRLVFKECSSKAGENVKEIISELASVLIK